MGVRLFQLDMREKTDRDGQKYLFAAIPEFDVVAMVFDDTEPGDEERRFTFVVKPFTKKEQREKAPAGDRDPWRD